MWKLLAPVVSDPITCFRGCWCVGSVSNSVRGSLSEGAAVAVFIEGGEGGAEQRRFRPGSGSPSSAESRDPPELGPAELDAGSASALTAFVASPA